MPIIKIRPDWPFAVNKLPFYYGWVIWLISTLGILASIPGQTMGMGVFTDRFIDAFGLGRTQLSIAYLLGTVGSSIFLTRAGRYYDRAGARITSILAAAGLGVFLLLLTIIDSLAGFVVHLTSIPAGLVSFVLITFGYFGVRFFGQGVMTSAARNVLLVWFDKRRGLVTGCRGIFVTLGFSLAPVFLALLITTFGWRGALVALALLSGCLYPLLVLVLLRDNPESCGLRVDGRRGDDGDAELYLVPDVPLEQARRDPVFWVYALAIAYQSLFGTAVVFHVVDIFSEAGRGSNEAFAFFLPYAVVSVVTNLVCNWLSDYFPLKGMLIAKVLFFQLGACGLLFLDTTTGYWVLIAGLGMSSGLWSVLVNHAWIRFYGKLFLGEISGFSMTLTVFASAVGPAMFSVGRDLFGSYHAAIWLSMILLVMLFIAAVIIPQREPEAVIQDRA